MKVLFGLWFFKVYLYSFYFEINLNKWMNDENGLWIRVIILIFVKGFRGIYVWYSNLVLLVN